MAMTVAELKKQLERFPDGAVVVMKQYDVGLHRKESATPVSRVSYPRDDTVYLHG